MQRLAVWPNFMKLGRTPWPQPGISRPPYVGVPSKEIHEPRTSTKRAARNTTLNCCRFGPDAGHLPSQYATLKSRQRKGEIHRSILYSGSNCASRKPTIVTCWRSNTLRPRGHVREGEARDLRLVPLHLKNPKDPAASGPRSLLPRKLAAKRNRNPTGEIKSNSRSVSLWLRRCRRNRYLPGGGGHRHPQGPKNPNNPWSRAIRLSPLCDALID